MTLPPALDGERFEFDGLSGYVAGEGPPLLLVHSVNAAASAAEVRGQGTWQSHISLAPWHDCAHAAAKDRHPRFAG